MKDYDIIDLTSNICQITGGFFNGIPTVDNKYTFYKDSEEVVTLDMEEKMLIVNGNLPYLQKLALASAAYPRGFECYSPYPTEIEENE